MIKKLLDKWKQEWFNKKEASLCIEYSQRLSNMMEQVEAEGEEKLDQLNSSIQKQIESKEETLRLIQRQNEDLSYEQKRLEDRRVQLIQAQEELRTQLRLIEAKASPASVFVEAFTLGVSKTWDTMLPIMQDNMDKLKAKIKEDATIEAVQRFKNAPNKK